MIARRQLPTIQSLGSPPEKHADRIVADMLRVIARARRKRWPAIHDALGYSSAGNPKAQRKMLARFEEAARPFCLNAHLEPGKRGHYVLTFACLEVWDVEAKTIADDESPETAWLAVVISKITGEGNHQYREESELALLVTHHALSRLTQRCGARTIYDVWSATIEIARAFFEGGWMKDGSMMLRDNTRMKVKLPRGMGTAICALRAYPDDDGDVSAVLVTLWKEDEEEPMGSSTPS
jgi:hypothetical protein